MCGGSGSGSSTVMWVESAVIAVGCGMENVAIVDAVQHRQWSGACAWLQCHGAVIVAWQQAPRVPVDGGGLLLKDGDQEV